MNDLIPTLLATAAVVATLTQVVKDRLGLSGNVATVLALLLGGFVGFGTLQGPAATLLPALPAVPAAVVLGLLAGVVASGGYKTVAGFQDRAAELRASAPATVPNVTVTLPAVPEVAPDGPVVVDGPMPFIGRHLPATMAQLPD